VVCLHAHVSAIDADVEEVAKIDQRREERARIIGGTDVPLNMYPWFARFTNVYRCGATLISPEYVLTAAHCINDQKFKLETYGGLYVGALCNQFKAGSNCDQDVETIGMKEIFVHPQYNGTTYTNDVALIRLETESEITPAKLDDTGISTFYSAEQSLFAIGENTNVNNTSHPSCSLGMMGNIYSRTHFEIN